MILYALFIILLILQLEMAYSISFILLIRDRYPYKEDLVSLYEEYVSNTDSIVIFPGIDSIGYTSNLDGTRVATYFSIEEISKNIGVLKDRVEYIAYNVEHNLSPDREVDDVVNSVKMASEIAHKNGFQFMLAPSGRLTEAYAREFAPYADVYILQYQALQSKPDEYARYVRDIVNDIREVDKDVRLIAQVSTLRGDVKSMIDSFNRVKDVVDGVTIFYGLDRGEVDKLGIFLDYVQQLRIYDAPLNDISLTDIKIDNRLESLIINNSDRAVDLLYIIKVKSGDEVIDILTYEESLKAYESKELSLSVLDGEYRYELFVWRGFEDPIPLAPKYIVDR